MNILGYLSSELSIDKEQLLRFVLGCPHRYKKYEIPKRNGSGKRLIAQPSKELKYLQRSVCKQFFGDLPVHASATAYRHKKSIKDNARIHMGKRYILKMDFKDFFPSIKPNDLISHIRKYGSSGLCDEDELVIERLFFYSRERGEPLELSIGSPASPMISNTVMYDFDVEVNKSCDEEGVEYSRYADDIAFSTNHKNLLFSYPDRLTRVISGLSYPRLMINSEKTAFLSSKGNMHVTGLVLTPEGKISVGRQKKRYIKSLVHRFTFGDLEEDEIAYLRGYLSFCSHVEPEFFTSIKRKYGAEVLNAILQKDG